MPPNSGYNGTGMLLFISMRHMNGINSGFPINIWMEKHALIVAFFDFDIEPGKFTEKFGVR